ncbi:MAG: sugar transferase [Candidatus Kapaibacterium sp.]
MEVELYRIKDNGMKHVSVEKLQKYLDAEVFDFIKENVNREGNLAVIDSDSVLNVDFLDEGLDGIINVHKINDINRVNKYFQAVNDKLNDGGTIIGSVEIYCQRKKRILAKHHRFVSYPIFYFDFLLKRVFPKLKITQGLYFFLTRGLNRAISRAEAYGRLYSCGFKITADRDINNILYFAFRKVSKPMYDTEPTYGPFVKLRRIGKDGKYFNVRKFRTMYAFSEFLQEWVYEQNDLAEGGKFKDDPRITRYGSILRKLWLDEFPMFWNVFKGQVKIVGVRPLSEHYFQLYDKATQERRIKYKPGLVPPYYVDLPRTLKEIQDSEMRYLDAYDKNPFKTQWTYFWKAMWNIFVKRARSA